MSFNYRMLKDLLLSIATPLTVGRSASKSSLNFQFPAIEEVNEAERLDSGVSTLPAKRRRLPRRRLSFGETFPRRIRSRKSNSLPGKNHE